MESDSRAFLIKTFTALRDDLTEQIRKGGITQPEAHRVESELPACEALLAALKGGEQFPGDEEVRQFVEEMARAEDELSGYEQAALGHRAFEELAEALRDRKSAELD